MTDAPTEKTDRRPPRDDRLTRVPVRHLYFKDQMTFPGTPYSTLSNLKGYPDPGNSKTYVAIEWLPAWQSFELTFHTSGERTEPRVRFVPTAMVSSWEREDGQR